MQNKYLVPLAIATIAIITGGVLLTQQLGMKPNLQTTVVNEEGEEVESKDITDTETGEKYTVIDEAGGYEYQITNGELVLTNPDTPVYVENREKPGEQILSCGQKVRLSDGAEKTAYYKGKDEDWTAALGSNWLSQAGLTKEEFDSLFREKRGTVKKAEPGEWMSGSTVMTVYSGRYMYKGFVSTGLYCTGGKDKTFLGWECSDLNMPKDTEVFPDTGREYCCNANPDCQANGGAGCSGAWNKVTMYSGGGRLWYRDECQEPQLPKEENPCQDAPALSLSTFTDTGGDGGTTYKAGDMVLATAEGGTGNCNIKTTANGWDSEIPFSLAKNQDDCVFGGIIPDNCTCDKCPSFTIEVDDGCNTETENFQCGCENIPVSKTFGISFAKNSKGERIEAENLYNPGSKVTIAVDNNEGGHFIKEIIESFKDVDGNEIDMQPFTKTVKDDGAVFFESSIPVECTPKTCTELSVVLEDGCKKKETFDFKAYDPCDDPPVLKFEQVSFGKDVDGALLPGNLYNPGDEIGIRVDGGDGSHFVKEQIMDFHDKDGNGLIMPLLNRKTGEEDGENFVVFDGVIPSGCTFETCPSLSIVLENSCGNQTTIDFRAYNPCKDTPLKIFPNWYFSNETDKLRYRKGDLIEIEVIGGLGPYAPSAKANFSGEQQKEEFNNENASLAVVKDGPNNVFKVNIPSDCSLEDCESVVVRVEDSCGNSDEKTLEYVPCNEGEVLESRTCVCWKQNEAMGLFVKDYYEKMSSSLIENSLQRKENCEAITRYEIQEKFCSNGKPGDWQPNKIDPENPYSFSEFERCECFNREPRNPQKKFKSVPNPPKNLTELKNIYGYNTATAYLEKVLDSIAWSQNNPLYGANVWMSFCGNLQIQNERSDFIYQGSYIKVTEDPMTTAFIKKTESFQGSWSEIIEQIFNELANGIGKNYDFLQGNCNIYKNSEEMFTDNSGVCRDFGTLMVYVINNHPKLQSLGIKARASFGSGHVWATVIVNDDFVFDLDPTNQAFFTGMEPATIFTSYGYHDVCYPPRGL